MRRTHIIRSLRVILPLIALALLSTLFLVGKRSDSDGAIPYVTGNPDDLARGTGITGAEYAGVTTDGTRITMSAAHAVPTDNGSAEEMRVDWVARDGLSAQLTAKTGAMGDGQITLGDGVTMSTSTGWRFAAPQMSADTNADRLTATGGITTTAPFGDLSADQMTVTRSATGSHVLDLNGRVRLIYRP
ncbi:MAG: hypothetical protein DI498_05845 [Paracoccus denitrificans]|nr:MAG: hypothetical protein DI498_05845 [Paracoccus denitrificans]PZO84950.1 MAG: hypothetical protein DI633_05845 [Paracoccus denitrificans]